MKKFVEGLKGWVGKIVWGFACILAAIILMGSFLIVSWSPGEVPPFLDADGRVLENSIAEKVFVEIGGVKQGMFIRGKNLENPILLFVHGGPGFPEYFLAEKYCAPLEEHFTLCYWEQRGSGLSYSPAMALEDITLERLQEDTVEVAKYLKERFHQEKVYLAAHSGGTAFAIEAAREAPDLFHAYIGIGQIVDQKESELRAYSFMQEEFSVTGESRMIKKLSAFPVLEDPSYLPEYFNSLLRDQAMHQLGVGTMRGMKSVERGLFWGVWKCEGYTVKEKINFWKAKIFFMNRSGIKEQVLNQKLLGTGFSLDVPAYFISGGFDMTVNYQLTRDFTQELEAPVKGFYLFRESAHSPIFEDPYRFVEIMLKDVKEGTNNLAEK